MLRGHRACETSLPCVPAQHSLRYYPEEQYCRLSLLVGVGSNHQTAQVHCVARVHERRLEACMISHSHGGSAWLDKSCYGYSYENGLDVRHPPLWRCYAGCRKCRKE